jgi:hypothetical protein
VGSGEGTEGLRCEAGGAASHNRMTVETASLRPLGYQRCCRLHRV